MAEPASTAATTLAAAVATVPMLTLFGAPLGLRPDLLLAGFSGALVGIVLLNTVPADDEDTWRAMVRTAARRMAVTLAGALSSGYVTPTVAALGGLAEPHVLGVAFAVGAGAQQILQGLIRRINPAPARGRAA